MRRGDTNDIIAPDGYHLGGYRVVRKDGTILFNRGWWQAPLDWAGEKVWVHETVDFGLEAAQPGLHIYEAQGMRPPHTVMCERTERPDARDSRRATTLRALSSQEASK